MFSLDKVPFLKPAEKSFNDVKPFPKDARVRVGVMGLAYCTLGMPDSQVNFLTHVPNHKLDVFLFQGKRTEREMSPIFSARVLRDTIKVSLGADATPTTSIETFGDYLLAETLNLKKTHGNKPITQKPSHGGKTLPVTLTLNNCAFYTEEMTEAAFDLVEINTQTGSETTVATRKFGDALGGKIKCLPTASGNLSLDISSLSMKATYPLLDTDGSEFIYDLYFLNHCVKNDGTEDDFKRYYEVLQDTSAPKKFEIRKIPKLAEEELTEKSAEEPQHSPFDKDMRGADISACNPVIIEP
jgi:hypothetical protein